MIKSLRSERGISIIAAVFTLIILGIFGVAIVALVAAEHEFRAGQLSEDWSFYNIQAGFEFSLREIKDGGYPLVTNKPFGKGTFSVEVNYDEASHREIIVTGKVGVLQKSHQISHTPFGGDCLFVDTDSVSSGGFDDEDVLGITLQKTCNDAVTVDKITISWEPDAGEKVKQIKINSTVVWEDTVGVDSGTTIDIEDTRLDTVAQYPVDLIHFSSNMRNKNVITKYIMTDGSTETVSFTVP